MSNIITLFTDASFCNKTKAAAWAAHAQYADDVLKVSARLAINLENPYMAEFYALYEGISFALHAFKPERGSKIVAYTDCIGIIHALNGIYRVRPFAKCHTERRQLISKINHALETFGAEAEYRHVKAHSENEDGCSETNAWCDTHSRIVMRTIRAEIYQQHKEKSCQQ